MHHFKALMSTSLILSFALVTFGCAASKLVSGKNQVSDMAEIKLSAETVPEGILVTFSNFSKIPLEIKDIKVIFRDWGSTEEPDWENAESLAQFNYVHGLLESFSINGMEQIRQTGTVIFPFVQSGHKYFITALFYNDEDISTITTECIADGGIYLNRDISLNINNNLTGVELSDEPEFTSDDLFRYQKISYYIVGLISDYWGSVVGSDTINDLSWDFEPRFSEVLRENGVANGDYPAYVGANLIIIYDNISWIMEIAKSPIFTYSL